MKHVEMTVRLTELEARAIDYPLGGVVRWRSGVRDEDQLSRARARAWDKFGRAIYYATRAKKKGEA